MTAATTATATYEPDLARVRLDLAGFQAGTTTVQVARREVGTGRLTLVRGARGLPTPTPGSDSFVLYDYEAPPGVEVNYEYVQAPDTTTYVASAAGQPSATYDVAGPWLKHVLRPYLNTRITVRGYQPFAHRLRATTYAPVRLAVPLGRADVRAGRGFAIDVDASTPEQRARLDDFLEVGGVVLLHAAGSSADLPSPVYALITDAAERVAGPARGGRRVFALQLEECQPPAIDVAASGITWAGVTGEWPTWADLTTERATWGDTLATVAVPTEVVIAS